jgi:sulfite reductase (ferredoxin)
MPTEANPKPVTLHDAALAEMSAVERLKAASEGLFYVKARDDSRHTFVSEIEALSAGEAQTLSEQAKELSKHFGIYKQRLRNDSGKKDGDFIFMVRVKNPAGGELSAAQWLDLDRGADYGDGSLRLTSRQGIQYHYVAGRQLRELVTHINRSHRAHGYQPTTLGACGDVNRNTTASPIDDLDFTLPLDTHQLAHEIARELAPRASAYYQAFLADEDGAQLAPLNSDEPLYGAQYLPRKFKIGFAHPHDNSVDLLTNDIGFLPVVEGGRVIGYDCYSGGGLGMTHNQAATVPLLAMYMGRVARDQVLACVRAIMILQRDYGERRDRRRARWKYTIRRLGAQWVGAQLHKRFGIALAAATPAPLPPVRDLLGWYREAGAEDVYYVGIQVPCGRLRDQDGAGRRRAIRRIVAGIDGIGVRITPHQSLLLTHIPAARRQWVEEVLAEEGVAFGEQVKAVQKLAMACPAKPTCGLAMTYAERDLPRYLTALANEGLGDVDVIIRMAGCPNGCSRPATAEIGITGYGKNEYVLTVGGARDGSRLGRVLYPRLSEAELVLALKGLVRATREHNPRALPAGDFLVQTADAELRRIVGLGNRQADEAVGSPA